MGYTEATRLYVANWRKTHPERYLELNRADNNRYYAKKSRWRKVQKTFFRETQLAYNLFSEEKGLK
jgi:hypothetical protein